MMARMIALATLVCIGAALLPGQVPKQRAIHAIATKMKLCENGCGSLAASLGAI